MKGPIAISVMVLTYQQADYIEAALESLCAQSIPVQIVVCDDGSTDGTAQIAERVLDKHGWPHGAVLIKHPQNLGVGPSYRDAFDKATAGIIMVNDGDDISLPHRAQVLRDVFASTGSLLVGSNVLPISAAGDQLDPDTFFWRVHDEGPVGIENVDPYARWCVLGACMAFNKSIWSEVGPLPPDVIMCDKGMTHRALALGNIFLLKEPLVKYRAHNQGLTSWLTYWSVDRGVLKRKLINFIASNRGLIADLDALLRNFATESSRLRLELIRQNLMVQTRLATAAIEFPSWSAMRTFGKYLSSCDGYIRKEAVKNLFLAIDPTRHEMWTKGSLREMGKRLLGKVSRLFTS